MDVPPNLSPENAIKLAYDFARNLRFQGAVDEHLNAQLVQWVESYVDSPLYIYLRAGFRAGYVFEILPWRREIEAPATLLPSPASKGPLEAE